MDFYAFLDEDEDQENKKEIKISSKKSKEYTICQKLQKMFNNGYTPVEKRVLQ